MRPKARTLGTLLCAALAWASPAFGGQEAFQPAGLPDALLREPPTAASPLDCSAAIPIACGETWSGSTGNAGPSTEAWYSCVRGVVPVGSGLTGRELVFSFSLTEKRTVGIYLRGGRDHRVMFLTSCDGRNDCFRADEDGILLPLRDPGDYYIVVDGIDNYQGPFDLTVLCEDDLAPDIFETTLLPGEGAWEDKIVLLNPKDIPAVDVMFSLDTTGSMGPQLDIVRAAMQGMLEDLELVIDDLQTGLITHEDYALNPVHIEDNCNYGEKYGGGPDDPYRLERPISPDHAELRNLINAAQTGNGGDAAESYLRVLHETVHDPAIGWRPNTRKFVVMVGDHVAHDCGTHTCTRALNWGQDPGRDEQLATADDLLPGDVIADMVAAGETLLFFGNSWTYWKCLAEPTGGGAGPGRAVVDDQNRPFREVFMEEFLSRLDTCGRLTLRPEPGWEDWLLTVVPEEKLDVALPLLERFGIVVGPPAGTPAGSYLFHIEAVCDGEVVGSQEVLIHVPECLAVTLPEDIEGCAGAPQTLQPEQVVAPGCVGPLQYRWLHSGVTVRDWSADPQLPLTVAATDEEYVLEVRCAGNDNCGTKSAAVTVRSSPDPIPPAYGTSLRVAKTLPGDATLRWSESDLAGAPLRGTELLVADADLEGVPDPETIRTAVVEVVVPAGVAEYRHATALNAPCQRGGVSSPCRLLFYKVRATSPCSETPGPLCNGFPAQTPCP